MLNTNTTGRQVTVMRIHQTTRMSGFGEIKGTIEVGKDKRDLGTLTATVTTKGVLLTFLETKTKLTYELEIPDANIVSRELVPEKNSKA